MKRICQQPHTRDSILRIFLSKALHEALAANKTINQELCTRISHSLAHFKQVINENEAVANEKS